MVLADVSHKRITLSDDTENSRHALSTFCEADRERAAIGEVLAALDSVCTVFPWDGEKSRMLPSERPRAMTVVCDDFVDEVEPLRRFLEGEDCSPEEEIDVHSIEETWA